MSSKRQHVHEQDAYAPTPAGMCTPQPFERSCDGVSQPAHCSLKPPRGVLFFRIPSSLPVRRYGTEWKSFVSALQLPGSLGWLLVSPTMLPMALRVLRKAGSAIAPVGHALTRLTMSPNAMVGAVKDNVVPGVCTASLASNLARHACCTCYALYAVCCVC